MNALKSDPNLANRTRVELRAAEQAVELAEEPLPAEQSNLGEHRVYMADRKVEIAKARATALHAEAQRERLIRMQKRTFTRSLPPRWYGQAL